MADTPSDAHRAQATEHVEDWIRNPGEDTKSAAAAKLAGEDAGVKTKIIDRHAQHLAEGTAEHGTVSRIGIEEHAAFDAKNAAAAVEETAAKKANIFSRTARTVADSFKHSGAGGRILKSGAALGSIIVAYKGVKNMGQGVGIFVPGTDDQGKEVPAGMGNIVKGLAELGIAAGITYAFILRGGKAAAPGR